MNTQSKLNAFMVIGLGATIFCMAVAYLMSAFVIPAYPLHAELITNVSLVCSYLAATSVGILVFGIYRRHFSS